MGWKQNSIFSLIILIVSFCPTSADDYYVATDGDNDNPGTLSDPWETIAFAARQACASDTVNIKGGNYGHEHVVIRNSGTSGNPITFQGYDGDVIINGVDSTGYGIHINNKEYITLDGFTITKYYFAILAESAHHIILNDNVIYKNYKGISFQTFGGHHNTITNIIAYNNDMNNIELWGCSDSLIEDCWSYSKAGIGTYTDYAYAIVYGSTNNTIKNCVAGQHAADGGESIGHGFAFRHSASHNKIINCSSYYVDCEHYKTSENSDYNEFIGCYADGQYEPYYTSGFNIKSSNNLIDNCVIQCVDYGVVVCWSTVESSTKPLRNNVIKNSIIVNNRNGIYVSSTAINTVLEYNNVWNNGNNYVGCSAGVGSISEDPGDINIEFNYSQYNSSWIPELPNINDFNDELDFLNFFDINSIVTNVDDIEYNEHSWNPTRAWSSSGYTSAWIEIMGYRGLVNYNNEFYIDQVGPDQPAPYENGVFILYGARENLPGRYTFDSLGTEIIKKEYSNGTLTAVLETNLEYHRIDCEIVNEVEVCERSDYSDMSSFTVTDTDLPGLFQEPGEMNNSVIVHNNTFAPKIIIDAPHADYSLGFRVVYGNESVDYFYKMLEVETMDNGFPYGNFIQATSNPIYENSELFSRIGDNVLIKSNSTGDNLSLFTITPYGEQELNYSVSECSDTADVDKNIMTSAFSILLMLWMIAVMVKRIRF